MPLATQWALLLIGGDGWLGEQSLPDARVHYKKVSGWRTFLGDYGLARCLLKLHSLNREEIQLLHPLDRLFHKIRKYLIIVHPHPAIPLHPHRLQRSAYHTPNDRCFSQKVFTLGPFGISGASDHLHHLAGTSSSPMPYLHGSLFLAPIISRHSFACILGTFHRFFIWFYDPYHQFLQSLSWMEPGPSLGKPNIHRTPHRYQPSP